MHNHTGREWEWHRLPDAANSTQNVACDPNPSTVQSEKEKTAEEKEKDEDKLWKDLEKVVGLDLTQELKKRNLFKPQPKENNHKVAVVLPKPNPLQTEASIRQIMAELSKELESVSETEVADARTTESSRCSAKEVTSLGGGAEVTTGRVGRGGRGRGRRGRRTGRNRSVEKDADYIIGSDITASTKPARGKRKASVPRGGPGKRPRRSPRTPTKSKEPKEVTLTKKDHKKPLKKSPILLDLLGKSGHSLGTVDSKIGTANLQTQNCHAEGSFAVKGSTDVASKVVMTERVCKEGHNVADPSAVVHQKNCSCCAKELHLAFPNKVNMRALVDQRPFYCNVCGARYNEEATLRMHMRLHPPGSQPAPPLRKNEQGQFICVVCGGKFSDKDELIRHSRIHPLLY
ncbi:PREDICTED: zinc finger protein with KRAB and SCAN domains 1-like [Branchiostoma belcheri]|uniref:Zinc finger protein with KRAB and SCAN domains 1-like n=1 Tax=Branchiostoma belcheri TaxID=7741 RepID=A0A6P4ZJA2_BRABE|nr:PREDICTED: zinc finger protein with KRAB and SCAN domains 1-like [Branchiostoma belcheri]